MSLPVCVWCLCVCVRVCVDMRAFCHLHSSLCCSQGTPKHFFPLLRFLLAVRPTRVQTLLWHQHIHTPDMSSVISSESSHFVARYSVTVVDVLGFAPPSNSLSVIRIVF